MKLLPKMFFVGLVVFILVFSFPMTSLAYTAPVPEIQQGPPDETGKSTIIIPPAQPGEGTLQGFQKSLALPEYNKESFDFQSLSGVLDSFASVLGGCIIDDNHDGQVDDDKCPNALKTNVVTTLSRPIAFMVGNPQASGIYYLADMGERLHLVQPAYAQTGFGFGAIDPFLRAWRAVRNFTYIFFVVAAIGFGIAIMIRARISPQAVITIQSAIPRLVIALILITFSYAIVGLLIDLIYIIFGILVFGIYQSGLTVYNPTDQFNEFRNAGFVQTFLFVLGRGIMGFHELLSNIPLGFGHLLAGLLTLASSPLVGALEDIPIIGGATRAARQPLVAIQIALLFTVIFFIFRVLLVLARAYLMFLIHLILAPILILWATLRGEGIWNGWLRGTLSHLLVFPALGILVWITDVLIKLIEQSNNLWAPPYVSGNPPLIKSIIAFGAVMFLPTLPDVISQMLTPRAPTLPLVTGEQIQRNIQEAIIRRVQPIPGGGPAPAPGGGGGAAGGGGAPPCMPGSSLVSTARGLVKISKLKVADLVWTINLAGEKVLAPIEFVVKRPVTRHKMLSILLADGRSILTSPMHPDANGAPLSNYKIGNVVDNSFISRIEIVGYDEGLVYDILPSGETGNYWANGVLVGSTLFFKLRSLSPQL